MFPRIVLAPLLGLLISTTSAQEEIAPAQQQSAIAKLSSQPGAEADRQILALFDRLDAHDLPSACWLELLEAAAVRLDPAVKARLAAYEKSTNESRDALRRFRECVEGGDAARGREIFLNDPRAGCIRCHRVSRAGGEIGPDLTSVRQVTDRVFILESIVEPSTVITNGFPHVLLKLASGEMISGIAGFESSEEMLMISTIDGKRRRIRVAEITERTALPSAMPAGFGQILGKRAVRDLVEFLATVE